MEGGKEAGKRDGWGLRWEGRVDAADGSDGRTRDEE